MTIQAYPYRHSERMNTATWVSDYYISNNPIILKELEALPDIYSIKKHFMIIVFGRISLQLNDQEEKIYSAGSVIDIPLRIKMNIKNCRPI